MDHLLPDATEDGTGVVATAFGAIVFLAFILLATHTLVGLYATSVTDAAAWDTASTVALSPASDRQVRAYEATDELRHRLSGLRDVRAEWNFSDPGSISLTVSAARPSILPASLAARSHLTTISRTVRVRSEVPR